MTEFVGGLLRGLLVTGPAARRDAFRFVTGDAPYDRECAEANDAIKHLLYQGAFTAALRLTAAEEHLSAAGVLLQDGMGVSAVPILRTAAYLAARTWWLTEPGLTPGGRATRVVQDMLDGLGQQAHQPTEGSARNLALKAEQIVDLCQEANIALGRKHGVPRTMTGPPSEGTLIDRILRQSTEGTLLVKEFHAQSSAFVHGKAYTLDYLVTPAEDDPDLVRTGMPKERSLILRYAAAPVILYRDAHARLSTYLGLEDQKWKTQTELVLNGIDGALAPPMPHTGPSEATAPSPKFLPTRDRGTST